MTSPTEGPTTDTDQYCYRHPDRVTGVRCTRCERPICPDCMRPASVGFQCPECVNEGNKSVRQARTIYGGRANRTAPGGLTRILIGINVAVFIITASSGANVLSGQTGNSTIYDRFAMVPVEVGHGQWYRLITAAFLHYGILHIAFNMWALWIVGPQLEAVLGRTRFIALYLLAGIGGSVLSLVNGPLAEQAAGASGAIFGLFGALYIVIRHLKLQSNGIVITIGANLVFTFAIPNIDWRGHVGGLVVGAAIAAVIAYAPKGPQRARLQAIGIALIAVVLAGVGFVAAHHRYNQCPELVTVHYVPVSCSAGPST